MDYLKWQADMKDATDIPARPPEGDLYPLHCACPSPACPLPRRVSARSAPPRTSNARVIMGPWGKSK